MMLELWIAHVPNFLLLAFGVFFGRYVIMAGGIDLACRVLARYGSWVSPLRAAVAPAAQRLQECALSTLSIAVFALHSLAVFWLQHNGYTGLYDDIELHGRLYFWLSIPLMLLIHDLYFYVVHYLMHAVPLLRRAHGRHHRSRRPSAWAAFSFHPAEAVIEGGVLWVFAFAMPVHVDAIVIFGALMTLWTVYIHCGYGVRSIERRSLLLAARDHDHHHATGRANYGLYLSVWDRLFGTLRRGPSG
jgi:sterol desaturase/sphingolipid hydroxylase (fatty acid hydroxylase superfamily)